MIVADTGTGIAPTDLPLIFTPFFSTKPAGRGSGLGLVVAEGIVADHGGHIEAHERDRSWHHVHDALPARASEPARAAPPRRALRSRSLSTTRPIRRAPPSTTGRQPRRASCMRSAAARSASSGLRGRRPRVHQRSDRGGSIGAARPSPRIRASADARVPRRSTSPTRTPVLLDRELANARQPHQLLHLGGAVEGASRSNGGASSDETRRCRARSAAGQSSYRSHGGARVQSTCHRPGRRRIEGRDR